MTRRWLLAVGALCSACFASPTPLAPGLAGSVGLPHHGVLTVAKELPTAGPGFRRFRRYGDFNWGHPRLVSALLRASELVAEQRPGGAPLLIGDLSARHGGKIPRHNSHRTGRDVDLLWYVTTPLGAPVESPGFVRIGADGLARVEPGGHYVRLDIPRQWLLIRTLLLDPQARVQLMLCSREIEALLIDYARARGEPDSLVWQAETVLIEPGDSLPHDDHIHLRIACLPEETPAGCEGGGPYWEWLPPLPQLGSDPDWLRELARDEPPKVEHAPTSSLKLTSSR
jgi:penicillin-insensitive murein endopeptidase